MKKINKVAIWAIIIVLTLMLVSCTANDEADSTDSATEEEATFTITGFTDGDITITLSEIKSFDAYEGRVEGADSDGDSVIYDVKGAYFADILEAYGYSQDDLTGIRIVASDGYSIEVSQDILQARDIILGYEMDGEALDADNAPLRVFIPEERAMYWVRMVVGIEVSYTEDSETVAGIYMMESLYSSDDYEDYEYIGQTYETLDTQMILSDYPGTEGDVVLMTASDGLEKNETLENFYKGVINMTGEESPEFMSSTLPGGMFVSELLVFKYGGNAFLFVSTALQGSTEITLEDVINTCNMEQAEEYVLNFEDGTQKTVESAELGSWSIGIEDEQVYACQNDTEEIIQGLVSINIK